MSILKPYPVFTMETQKLTVRLPQDDLKFIKQFAIEHNTTVTELIRRHLSRLRQQEASSVPSKLQQITGILPKDLDTENLKQDYYEHLLEKHQWRCSMTWMC